MKLSEIEKDTKNYYEDIWSNPKKIKRENEDVTLGYHYGFYEKGIKTIRKAMENMILFIEKMINLEKEDSYVVLDAGCGIGSTSVYLSEKYENSTFFGIMLTKSELEIANKLKKQKKLDNLHFYQRSYMDSNFEKDYFDRIFALESACYSPNKNVFLKEMNRILKNKGELLIIDTFPKNRVINSLTVNVYNYLRDLKCSENDIKNFYVEIDRFRNYLELNKFREISTRDLVSLGNVKKSHIYAFLVFRIFPNIKSKIKKNWKRSLRFTLFVPFLIIIFFVYELLLIFYERPSYYCVKAKK